MPRDIEDPKSAPKRDADRDDAEERDEDGEASERVQRKDLDRDGDTIEDDDILEEYAIADYDRMTA